YEPNSVFAAITASTDPLCFGGCDGTATVSASGGTGAGTYTFLWDAGGATASANNNGLCAGNVSVVVTDANGCSFTANGTLGEPTLLIANTLASSNVVCFGNCDGSVSTSA